MFHYDDDLWRPPRRAVSAQAARRDAEEWIDSTAKPDRSQVTRKFKKLSVPRASAGRAHRLKALDPRASTLLKLLLDLRSELLARVDGPGRGSRWVCVPRDYLCDDLMVTLAGL